MQIETTAYFERKMRKKITRKRSLSSKFKKQLKLLAVDFRHPSLRLHKLKGDRSSQYAFWLEGDLRVLFTIESGVIILVDVITHDQY